MMKAAMIATYEAPIEIGNVDTPSLNDDSVLVRKQIVNQCEDVEPACVGQRATVHISSQHEGDPVTTAVRRSA